MHCLKGAPLAFAISLAACGGGQSFDDGGDPLKGATEEDERPAPTTDPGTDPPEDASTSPSTAPTTAMDTDGAEPTSSQPAEDASTDEPAPMSVEDAGPVPDSGSGSEGGSGEIEFDFPEIPDGPDTSMGSVVFTFTVEDDEAYCTDTSVDFAIRVEDGAGRSIWVREFTDLCGRVRCGTCEPNEPCPAGGDVGDVYYPRFFGAGGTLTWDGGWLTSSGCVSATQAVACYEPTYAAAGTYTAVFCADRGEPIESPPDECSIVQNQQDCIRVPFEYPTEAAVEATMATGGDGPEGQTFVCGGAACAQGQTYCLARDDGPLRLYSCEPLPDECRVDASCGCLTPHLETGQTCLDRPRDGGVQVNQQE